MPFLSADTPMYDLLRLFKTGRSHMVMLTKPTSDAVKQRRPKPLHSRQDVQVLRVADFRNISMFT